MRSRKRAVCGAIGVALAIAAGVAPPAGAQLTHDCRVADGGRILAANTDRATFGGNATTTGGQQLGHQVYVDHGPTTPLRFRSVVMTAVLCNPDARRALMIGTGTVELPSGAEQAVQYEIEVGDFGEFPFSPPDSYRITLTGGFSYTSGEQPVEQGNIQISFP